MNEKTVRVTCTGFGLVNYHDLTEIQGNFKQRTDKQIAKLKRLIIKKGFSFPFFIWQQGETNFIIDGHGRILALQELEREGWIIPSLPAIYILADNEHDAILKLLKANSRYGDITEAAFAYFADGVNVEDLSDIEVRFDKVEILQVDSDKYLEEVRSMLEISGSEDTSQKDINIDIICPCCMDKCSFSLKEIKKAIK